MTVKDDILITSLPFAGPRREREVQSARARPNTAVKINAPPGGRADSFWCITTQTASGELPRRQLLVNYHADSFW